MRFQYVIGRSGVGKSEYVMQQFVKQAQQSLGKEQFFYLVPDQMSFQAEWQLLRRFPNQIASNIFSYSFKNIVSLILTAWQQQQAANMQPISDLGLQMIIRQVLLEQQKQLKVYQSVVKQPGFANYVRESLHEFQNWQINTEAYQQVSDQSDNVAFQNKLADLALIQQEVAQKIAEQGLWTPAQQLAMATELLSDQKLVTELGLSQATIVIDGFHSFNKLEQNFLQALSVIVKQTTLVLTVDRPYQSSEYEQSQTFFISGRTYWQFRQFTTQAFAQAEVEEVWLNPTDFMRSQKMSLQYLEKWLAAPDIVAMPHRVHHDEIQVIGAMNRLREVEALAQKVRQRILQGSQYHEIAVYVSQKDAYFHLIKRIFPLYDIPFFLDEKTSMHFHPVLETIIGSLGTIKNNWQYEELFRTLKAGFFNWEQQDESVYSQELAVFERYCLKRGKFGRKHWIDQVEWEYREFETIEHLQRPLTKAEVEMTAWLREKKTQITEPLHQLEQAFKKAKTVAEYSQAIFDFLVTGLDVPKQLTQQITDAEQRGDVIQAKQNQQVWQQLIQVFEELVTVAGSQEVSLADYVTILETGLEQLQFQIAPPALDQVLVGDFERARFQMAKNHQGMGIEHAFILGINEGVVPFTAPAAGLLTEQDRQYFKDAAIQLAPNVSESIASQALNFYMVATSARQSITLSYVLADGENGESEMYPARILQQICEQFAITPQLYPQELGQILQPYALTAQASYRYLHHHLQQALQGEQLAEQWQATYNWLMQHHEQSYFVQRSLNYRNSAVTVEKKLLDQCFEKKISGTATRIETYNRCPYRFYAQYMLHLEQPNDYEIAFLQIGNLYHHCLELISLHLFANKQRFADLTRDEIIALTHQAIQQLEPYLTYNAFYETARSRYLLHKLQQNVIVSIERLVQIDQHSQFQLRFAEVSFGQKQSAYAARQYPIAPDYTLSLRGKIDRIDTLETATGTYVRIIDYKSTDKSIDFDEIYHGLSLQMPMYLDVATHDILPEAQAAGMFYFTIQNKKVRIEQNEVSLQTGTPQQQLMGYALADETIIAQMDDTFIVNGKTAYIRGIRKGKSGFYQNSTVLSKKELVSLTTFTNEKLIESAEKIVAGEVPIEPKGIKQLPCGYCPYRSLCQFDQQLPENPGCYATTQHKRDVLASMSEEE